MDEEVIRGESASEEPAKREAAAAPTAAPDVHEGQDADEVRIFYPLGHYYSPVPDTRRLASEPYRSRVWPKEPYETPATDWRGEEQLELCKDIFARQTPLKFASEPTGDPAEYFTSNIVYPPLDASVLQAMLRHLRPRRMIEVGCGYSSLVTAQVNRDFLDGQMRFTCIDPYPPDFLAPGVPGISDLRTEEIQATPLELFEELEENDVVFIDTSHTVKTGGDVPWIYHQIFPRLKRGVLVHVHDMFLPGEYPSSWVLEGWGWNEIYLMQSFLDFNSAFEVAFSVHWMLQNHPEALREAFPDLSERETKLYSSASLWIRRRA